MSIVNMYNQELEQLDTKTNFRHGNLEETVNKQ